ncbi:MULTISPECIES: hypothetical protein [Paraburkholderia]|jgi:hypothetical protein|uniref:Uncharacterized protein n=2 Tax=Paraburkholderia TaxID=1822464 RepID=A0A7I8BLW5_9BURK|nr:MULTISPECIES: hypothetical protein [Paraburkholderia]BCF89201.1 hypothetical protein PPGU16_22680 [Paraburkholderia sp. PGU16]BEU22155.1 hypothetical protein PBP221_22950 [Paraburkholderia sp. 22B1P]CAG9252993.1 conserved hypothetical protein [Paraburkholderia caribensis]
MRSEQYEYNDDQTPLPNPCYDGLYRPASQEKTALPKRSAAGVLTFSIAWLFGLEALLSDDEN